MFTTNMKLSQQAGFAMPTFGSVLVAAVRALPVIDAQGGVSAVTAERTRAFDATTVCGYRHIATGVAVLKGAFPGTSAWSPPI